MQTSNFKIASNSRKVPKRQLPSIFQQLVAAPLQYSQFLHTNYALGSFNCIPPLALGTYGTSKESKYNKKCIISDPASIKSPEMTRYADIGEFSKCPDCKLRFKNAKGMHQHMGKVHSKDVKKVPCTICQKSFKNKYAMKFHIKQVHEKSTRVACNTCGTTIYNKYMLKKHIQKHTG